MTKIIDYAALMFTLALVTGCSNTPETTGQNPPGTNTPSASTQPGYNSTPATEASADTQTAAKGTVEVTLTEYKIEMPASAVAGATTFKVTNAGKEVHSFEVEGNGIEKEIKPDMKVGETKTLQVDLKPGTYKVYCPVGGHEKLGMSVDLTVK